jgi:outer membrane protein assembly factor BamB
VRARTAVALAVLLVLLGGVTALGVLSSAGEASLTETWVSDTPRENEFNHHAVGVGLAGEVVVAPVMARPAPDVTLTDDSCVLARFDPADGSVRWRNGVSAGACASHALTQPAIDDVDRDGTPEAVVATTEEELVAHDVRDGGEEWRLPLPSYGYGRPTTGNLTPAPGPEVVASDIQGNVLVARGNGTVAWRHALNTTLRGTSLTYEAPVVRDVDADDEREVLLGTGGGTVLLGSDGSVEWSRRDATTTLVSADADADPALEVFETGGTTVRARDGATGETEWARSLSGARFHAAADADGDGRVELVAALPGGTILALDGASGETEWSTNVTTSEDGFTPPPALGDIDGDGDGEVVAATNAGAVVVLDASTGEEMARYEREVPIWTFVTVADVEEDGRAELLVRYGDGRVVALDYE